MDSAKKRHQRMFLKAFIEGMGGGMFSEDRHPISGLRDRQDTDAMKRDLEKIGGDFHTAIGKEKARRSVTTG